MAGNRFNRNLAAEGSRQQFTDGQIFNTFVASHGTNRCTLQETMMLPIMAILFVVVMMMVPVIVVPARAIRCSGFCLSHDRSRDHGTHPNNVPSRAAHIFLHSFLPSLVKINLIRDVLW
jgi:hypothetical protein